MAKMYLAASTLESVVDNLAFLKLSLVICRPRFGWN